VCECVCVSVCDSENVCVCNRVGSMCFVMSGKVLGGVEREQGCHLAFFDYA
jgi:hypothetical protein